MDRNTTFLGLDWSSPTILDAASQTGFLTGGVRNRLIPATDRSRIPLFWESPHNPRRLVISALGRYPNLKVESSHSRFGCLNGEYPFCHARAQRSAICLVGLAGTNSCRPAANSPLPSNNLPLRVPLTGPSGLTSVYRCGITTSNTK